MKTLFYFVGLRITAENLFQTTSLIIVILAVVMKFVLKQLIKIFLL